MELKITNQDFSHKVNMNRTLKKGWPRIDITKVQFANLKDDEPVSLFDLQKHYNNVLISVAIDVLPIKQQIGFDAIRFVMGKPEWLKLHLVPVDPKTLKRNLEGNIIVASEPSLTNEESVDLLDKAAIKCNLYTEQDFRVSVILMLVDKSNESIIDIFELPSDVVIDYVRETRGIDEEVTQVTGTVPLRLFLNRGKRIGTLDITKQGFQKWCDSIS